MTNWRDRTVVVTGASAGLGRTIARAFGRQGAKVALLARGEERLAHVAEEIAAAGGIGLPIPTDVSDADAVEDAAEIAERQLGPIDAWVNDAMATIFARADEVSADEIRRATEVTYLGAAYGTLAALRRMRPRNHGSIVQVGSALAYRAIPLQSAYCGAKHALRGFTDSVRCELMHDQSQVWITSVHMPALNTTQFDWVRTRESRRPRPVKPVFQPEAAADAVVYAAGARRRELWVGSSTIATIVANRMAPGLLDRYLARSAFKGQLTDNPVPPDYRDYLFEPVPGDPGIHGSFDDESAGFIWGERIGIHRPAAIAGAAKAAYAAWAARRS